MIRRPPRSTPFPTRRSSDLCVLLADAAGAAVLEATEDGSGFLDGDLYSDGQYWDLLYMPARKDRKSTRLNSSHVKISYAVFCLKKKNKKDIHLSSSNMKHSS